MAHIEICIGLIKLLDNEATAKVVTSDLGVDKKSMTGKGIGVKLSNDVPNSFLEMTPR